MSPTLIPTGIPTPDRAAAVVNQHCAHLGVTVPGSGIDLILGGAVAHVIAEVGEWYKHKTDFEISPVLWGMDWKEQNLVTGGGVDLATPVDQSDRPRSPSPELSD